MGIVDIFLKFKTKIILTFSLVFFEAIVSILFPLFIGYAIDDIINKSLYGIYALIILGMIALALGASRRFYDSRVYAKIYQSLGVEMAHKKKELTTSKISARLKMLEELIEFFEFSFPDLIVNLIGLVGTLIIVFSLNEIVFYGCLVNIFVILIVYFATSNKTFNYNKQYNTELENQVDVLETKDIEKLKFHIRDFMKWNIKLSDLEMINFSIIWLFMLGLLLFSIFIVVENGVIKYGAVFSILMYVFQFMESAMNLPYYYQQWLRLQEITERFKSK